MKLLKPLILPLALLALALVASRAGAQPARPNYKTLANLPVFDVTAAPYNANGTDAVDDTAAIQAALTAAKAVKGIVEFPAGTYLFNQTLVLDDTVTLRGAGRGEGDTPAGQTILQKTADVVGIKVLGQNVTVEKLVLTCSIFTGTTGGIEIGATDATNGAGHAILRDLTVMRQRGDGIWAKNGNGGRIDNVWLHANGSHGIRMQSTWTGGGSNVNAWSVTHAIATSNGGNGFHLALCQANEFVGIRGEGNTGLGFYVNDAYNRISYYVEANTAGSFTVGGSAFNCVITGHTVGLPPTITNPGNWIYAQDGAGKYPYLTYDGLLTANNALTVTMPAGSAAAAFTPTSTNGMGMFLQQTGASGFNAAAYVRRTSGSTGAGEMLTIDNAVVGSTARMIGAYSSTGLKFEVTSNGSVFANDAEIDGALNHDGTTVGFYGVAPVTRAGATADLKDALALTGLLTNGGASPLNLDGGVITADASGLTNIPAPNLVGLVPITSLPSITIGETFTAANQAAMLALAAEQGDIAQRTDEDGAKYYLGGADPTILANWIPFASAGNVASVNGETGAVVLDAGDVGAYTTAQVDTALGGKSNTGHTHPKSDISLTGTWAVADIPALPISKTTLLQATLDAKAALAGGNTFTELQTFNVTSGSPVTFKPPAAASVGNLTLWKDETGATVGRMDDNGQLVAALFSGSGASLTDLNASNLATGTVPNTRLPGATDTAAGTVELATLAETNAHTDTARAVTPADLADHMLTSWTLTPQAPLNGGGTGTANRTIGIDAATTTAAGAVELATNAETLTGTDTTRAVTPSGVAAAIAAGPGGTTILTMRQTADVTNATTTPAAVTGMSFTYAANTFYRIEWTVYCTSVAATTGYAFTFDVTTAPGTGGIHLQFEHGLAATGTLTGGYSVGDNGATVIGVSSGVPIAGQDVPVTISCQFHSGGTGGTGQLMFRPEVAASATIKAGSVGQATVIP